jgi:hypothetical protein
MLRSRVAREDGDTSRVRPSDSKRWGRLPASAVSNQPHFMATTFYGDHIYGRPHLYMVDTFWLHDTHTQRGHTAYAHTDGHAVNRMPRRVFAAARARC